MEGWIKIHRQIQKHWIWDNPDYLKAWIAILMTVNHEEKKILIHGELFECGRGESFLSLSNWTKTFGKGWTMRKTRTFFELLKNDSMIDTKGHRKTTHLKVCNYDSYQEQRQANDKQTTSRRQADDKQTTTNKNDKNEKNNNTGGNSSKIKGWLELVEDSLKDSVSMFMEYKIERRESYKTEKSFMLMVAKLKRFSGGDPDKAKMIVEQSMSNNWAGLFELKNRNYEQTTTTTPVKTRKKLH